jgi:hypothetical protein
VAAPAGNQNAKKAKRWEGAITRALAKVAAGAGVEAGLDTLAEKLVTAAAAGEQWALLEIGNRMDGKPAQAVSIDGDGEGGPVKTLSEILIRAVDAAGDRST